MKLESVKLANSINIANKQETFLASDRFELALENSVIIRVKEKRTGDTACTSLFNCIFWREMKEGSKIAEPQPSVRGSDKSRGGSRGKKDPSQEGDSAL